MSLRLATSLLSRPNKESILLIQTDMLGYAMCARCGICARYDCYDCYDRYDRYDRYDCYAHYAVVNNKSTEVSEDHGAQVFHKNRTMTSMYTVGRMHVGKTPPYGLTRLPG